MRRCAFSTNNNTTGTSDLTAPSRGRLFLTPVRHRRIAPHSATRRPARRTSFGRGRSDPARRRQTAGQPRKRGVFVSIRTRRPAARIARRSDPHGDRPCRIEDLPPPIRHIVPHATETRRLPVVPARRAAFPRRRLPTYGFPAGCGGACDDARRKRIGRIPARRGTGQKKGGRVLLFRPIRSCRTTHSLGSI